MRALIQRLHILLKLYPDDPRPEFGLAVGSIWSAFGHDVSQPALLTLKSQGGRIPVGWISEAVTSLADFDIASVVPLTDDALLDRIARRLASVSPYALEHSHRMLILIECDEAHEAPLSRGDMMFRVEGRRRATACYAVPYALLTRLADCAAAVALEACDKAAGRHSSLSSANELHNGCITSHAADPPFYYVVATALNHVPGMQTVREPDIFTHLHYLLAIDRESDRVFLFSACMTTNPTDKTTCPTHDVGGTH